MNYRTILLPLFGALAAVAGCDALAGLLSATTVTVRLVNNTAYSVDAEIYTHDDDGIESLLITELGQQHDQIILAGQTASFALSCEDLQAIVVDDADLQMLIGLGPETSSDVLRDGEDFNCGDVITFTFSYENLDFDVTTTVTDVPG